MTDITPFFQKVNTYTTLSPEAEADWRSIIRPNSYDKGEDFIRIGNVPRNVAFVVKGLFAQSYIADSGESVIKYFFPEGRIAGSIPATLTRSESLFSISALEATTVLEYNYHEFKRLVTLHASIATFYIHYMERHWIIDKEPYEISLRHDTAKSRYDDFIKNYPELLKRVKKHHIASYLGITPTQMSRIFFANK